MDKATINKLAGSVFLIWNEPEKPKPFLEYPKLVYLADGSYVKVDNAEEEAAARGKDEEHHENPSKPRRGRPPKAKE
jgi:hypothetical protein